jgi:uncharacterized RDD family membrane protein YckC
LKVNQIFNPIPYMQNSTLAGFGARLVAQIIDSLIVGFVMSIFIIPIFGIGALTGAMDDSGSAGLFAGLALLPIMLMAFVGPVIYEVFMLSSSRQATFGKVIMKIKVIDEHGQKLTIGAAAGRTLVKYLTVNFCFLLWLWPLFNKEEQALHDLVVRDLVIRD